MRHIKGYVFLTKIDNRYEPMFGKGVKTLELFNSFATNDLTPYNGVDDARRGAENFRERPGNVRYTSSLGRIEMEMAESRDEISVFERQSGLVVVMTNDSFPIREKVLFGPIVQGRSPGVLPCWQLYYNGYRVFRRKQNRSAFERALFALTEINRQAQSAATIAKFRLERLETLKT